MKKIIIFSLVLGFLISFSGFITCPVFAQGGYSNIEVEWSDGNQVWKDKSSQNTIFTVQADETTPYSDGVYVENDEGTIELSITEAYSIADGYGVVADGTTTPGLATNDGCPTLVWASTETFTGYAVSWTFVIPRDFRDGTDLTVEASFSTASASSGATFEYGIYVNTDATAFDTAYTGVPLTALASSTNTTFDVVSGDDTTNDVDAGDRCTLLLYPIVITTGNVELRHIRVRYPRQFNN